MDSLDAAIAAIDQQINEIQAKNPRATGTRTYDRAAKRYAENLQREQYAYSYNQEYTYNKPEYRYKYKGSK